MRKYSNGNYFYYFSAPSTPEIDIRKCSRSCHSVVLVLALPDDEFEVINGFHVFYSDRKMSDLSKEVCAGILIDK